MQTGGWVLVLPYKGTKFSKSRLGDLCPGRSPWNGESYTFGVEERTLLAAAFLRDTLRAAAAAPSVSQVIVITKSPEPLGERSKLAERIHFVSDRGEGLNEAVEIGSRIARRQDDRVGVLMADLPMLRVNDLEEGLRLADHHCLGVVADGSGTGSTLITTTTRIAPLPQFGRRSFSAHVTAGFVPLRVASSSTLRADVDYGWELRQGLRRGVGPATERVLRQLRPSWFHPPDAVVAGRYSAPGA